MESGVRDEENDEMEEMEEGDEEDVWENNLLRENWKYFTLDV